MRNYTFDGIGTLENCPEINEEGYILTVDERDGEIMRNMFKGFYKTLQEAEAEGEKYHDSEHGFMVTHVRPAG